MRAQIALVTGCPRSGTSIMGEVLALAGDAEVVFEPAELRAAADAQWFRDLGPGRWVVKAPFASPWVPRLLAELPELQVVFMLRDWRDVVASLWAARQQEIARAPVSPEIGIEFALAVEPLSLAACRQIIYDHQAAVDGFEHSRFRFQEYEDLVDMPCITVQNLLAELGWQLHPEALHRIIQMVGSSTSGYEARGQAKHYVPHCQRVGRWRELPEPERSALEAMVWDPPETNAKR